MPTSLVTKAEYKTYSGINSTTFDDKIDILIPEISALVKNYCNRSFVDNFTVPQVEYPRGGTYYLELRDYPVIALTLSYSNDYGITYTDLVEKTDYVLEYDIGSIQAIGPNVFPSQIKAFKASYTSGYATVPLDLKQAVFDLITYYLKNDNAVHNPRNPATSSAQVEYIRDTKLPANIARILDFYRTSAL